MVAIDPFAGAPTAPAPDEAQAAPQEPAPQDNPNTPEQPGEFPKAPAKKSVGTVTVDVQPKLLPAFAEGKHVVTLKGGADYDAPWYVIHASGIDELEEFFGPQGGRVVALMERIQFAANHFGSLAPAKVKASGMIGPGQRQEAPQAAQEAPNGEKRHCAHGEMKFVSQLSKKTGKPYKAFFCNSGDRNNECEAVFLR